MSLKPVCVKCRCFYRPHKNGYSFIEGMPNGTKEPEFNIRGNRAPEAWSPYKLWVGDLWKCPDCGHEIIVGALNPVSEHYMDDFNDFVEKLGPKLQVNDC